MKYSISHNKELAPPQSVIPQAWSWHFKMLQELRERLGRNRDSQREETLQPLVQDTNDPADCATDEFDHDLAFSLLSHEESVLLEVDAAIQRIQAGKYGICEETGKTIPADRLRAIPWTRYLKEAQEQLEGQGLVEQLHLACASDIHGPLVRSDTRLGVMRLPRKRSKAARRAGTRL
jgi:RNA polymerase-binding protein DksA